MNIKIVHKFIRPAVKSFERLPMNVKSSMLQILDLVLFPRTLAEIRRVKNLEKVGARAAFQLDRNTGLAKFNVEDMFTNKAIAFSRKSLEKYLHNGDEKSNSKDYLRQIFHSGMLSSDSKFLLDWATSPEVLLPVSSYFRKYPLLHDISVFYSPPTSELQDGFKGSQLFHMDGGGTQCVKLWLLCEDVALENGPTVLVPASISQTIAKELGYEPGTKIADSTVGNVNDSLFFAAGPAGSWFATDTDRCLHYGSRTGKSTGRLVLMFHFVEHNSTYYLPIFSQNYWASTKKISKEFLSGSSRYAKWSLRKRTV
jgi:hypothetical protein